MLLNKTKNYELASNIIVCKNIFSTSRGLMFRKQLKDSAMVLKLRSKSLADIHTFFVFFPIDVLWLDGNKIVDLRENILPFRFRLASKSPANYVVELPAGTIRKSKTEIGDKIVYK